MQINRNWRRALRIGMALVTAIGTGTLVAPDYVPANLSHVIQETCAWLSAALAVANPFLDLGADDIRGNPPKP